jgi:HEAT repeat protein
MEDEALDARGRNITLIIFGAIVLLIAGLVFNNWRVKQARIAAIKSPDPARQRAAMKEMMAGFTNDGHIAEQLQGERPSVRAAAVRALQALAEDPETKVRKDAARLIVPFMKDSDQPIKDQAVQSLTAMGPDIAMDAAVNALGDSDNNVKGGAQTVCQNFAGASIAPLLAFASDAGKTDGKKAVLKSAKRGAAGAALSNIAKSNEAWKTIVLFGEQAVKAREVTVGVPAPQQQRKVSPEAAREKLRVFMGVDKPLLGNPSDPVYGVVEYLNPQIANEDDQNNAIGILDSIGDVRAVHAIIPKLESPTTRRAAVGALGRLGDPRATPFLLPYLSSDETNRLEIVIALGRIADPKATDALIAHGLGSVSQPVRAASADSLRSIALRSPGSPTLARLTAAATGHDPKDPEHYKAEGATRALAGLRIPSANQVAVKNLAHGADNVREAAASALGESGNPAAIAPLVARFDDTNGRVAEFAARSIATLAAGGAPAGTGESGAPPAGGSLSPVGQQAVAQLVAALSNPTRVYYATRAILYIGPATVPALQNTLLNGNDQGALAAATLLGDLGDPAAIDPLKKALEKRKSPDFQFAASSSIQRLGGQVAPTAAAS